MRQTFLSSFAALAVVSFGIVPGALAQDTVAPTTSETVGNVTRGQDVDGGKYNVIQSFEFGYRFRSVDGDLGKYQSDVNYGNGLRLLSSYFTMNSKDGHGKYFDEVVLTTLGLGNDPYESATLRVQKNRLYRYDMVWRQNSYRNPGLATAAGLHADNYTRRWQDHDVVLFPQSHFRVMAGYSRNKEDGAALSTINLFENQRGDIFSLFNNVRREYNSYRIGGTLLYGGMNLTVIRRWEFFKEDTPSSLLSGASAGLNTTDASTLTNFQRGNPIHGSTPSWLVQLMGERRWIAANGRFTYAAGRNDFNQSEIAVGTGLGGVNNRLISTQGTAQRPVVLGDLNLTLMPGSRVTVTNNTSVANTRIDGNSSFTQFDLGTFTATTLNFQFLGIRRIVNATDAHIRVAKKLDFFTGYRFANREIRSIQSVTDPKTAFSNNLYSQENSTYAGVAGVNWNVIAPLRVHFEIEVGRHTNPFYPISEKDYHAIDARVQYRKKNLSATAGYRETNNDNSISLTTYSATANTFYSNAAWSRKDWFTLDLGYSHLHNDSLGGIVYFAGTPRPTLQSSSSLYVSNIHAANLGVRFAIQKKAVIYAGYNITQDTGDGRASQANSGNAVSDLFSGVQTFPLRFHSPLVRLTVPLTAKLKWNFGYQHYGYSEDFGLYGVKQDYRAHTGYTSLLWAF